MSVEETPTVEEFLNWPEQKPYIELSPPAALNDAALPGLTILLEDLFSCVPDLKRP